MSELQEGGYGKRFGFQVNVFLYLNPNPHPQPCTHSAQTTMENDDATVMKRFTREQHELGKVYEYQQTQRDAQKRAVKHLHEKCVRILLLKNERIPIERAYDAVVKKVDKAKREAKKNPNLDTLVHEAKKEFYTFIKSPENKRREHIIEEQNEILSWLNAPRTRKLRNMVISKIVTSRRPMERLFTIASPDLNLLARFTPKAIKSLDDEDTKLFHKFAKKNFPGNTQHLTMERYTTHNSAASLAALAAHIREITTRECSICMDSITIEATLGCNHVFHHGCIHKWVTRNPSCPVCRAAIKPRDLVL